MGMDPNKLPPQYRAQVAAKKKTARKKPADETPKTSPVPTDVRWERDGDTITVWLAMMGKPRMTARDKWKQRPCVMRYRAMADILRAAVPEDMLLAVQGVSWKVWLPLPRGRNDREKAAYAAERAGQPHLLVPDIDNITKGVQDIIFKQDSQLWFTRWQEKRWDDGLGPRIILTFHYTYDHDTTDS